jgi:hypothetical protein
MIDDLLLIDQVSGSSQAVGYKEMSSIIVDQ